MFLYNISFFRIYRRRGFFILDIPSTLQEQFEEYLRNKPIPKSSRGAYKKWLRYYLDFCRKYNFPPIRKESLPHFIRKLQEKKQAKVQQEQAAKAITLYGNSIVEIIKQPPVLAAIISAIAIIVAALIRRSRKT